MDIANRKKIAISPRMLVLFFIVCNPLIEIIYAMFSVGYSGVLNVNRILRFVALSIMLVDIKNRKNLKKLLNIAAIFGFSYLGVVISGNQISIGTDIGYLIKIYMGFVTYYYFYEKLIIGHLTERAVFSSLICAAIIVSSVIILSLFGVGFQTYSGNRFGFRGLFAAANLPTAYLLMVLPIAFCFIKTNNKFAIIAIVMSCIALPLLGTKTGVLGTLLVFFVIGVSAIHKRIKKTTVVLLLIGLAASVIVLVFIINKYIPYLKSLFLTNSFYNNSIYSFILSNRDTQVLLASQYLESLSGSESVLAFLSGVGYSRIENVLSSAYSNYLAVERDFHAIFFYCGAVILIMVLYRIINGIKTGFINWRRSKSQEDFYLLLALSIATVHAYLGGHTLTDSMCIFSIYIIMAAISARHVKVVN